MNKAIRSKLIAYFVALGLPASTAFVAYDVTLPNEGLVQKVYYDPVGLPTVCVGHMDESLKKGTSYSLDECMRMFAMDVSKHQKQLDSVVKTSYKSEWERAALTDFTFNVGIGSVKGSSLLKLVNSGRHREACYELARWVKGRVGGKMVVLRGLVGRRDQTMQYCLGEIPYDKQKAYVEFRKEYEAEINRQLAKRR